MSALKQRLVDDMKSAMRAKEKDRLLTVRTILAAIKQQEVDTREDVDEAGVLAILDKQSKQRRESIAQFTKAGRDDLVAQEELELVFIQEYLPEPLSDEEVQSLIKEAIASTGAESSRSGRYGQNKRFNQSGFKLDFSFSLRIIPCFLQQDVKKCQRTIHQVPNHQN